MISARLRNFLGAVAMTIMVAGPLIALIGIGMGVGTGEASGFGRHLGTSLKLAAQALVAGGVLRLLVSIDARLETKA